MQNNKNIIKDNHVRETYSKIFTAIILTGIIANTAQGAPAQLLEPNKATGQSLNVHHAQYNYTKSGFNPPRQISPHQFEQLLKENKNLDAYYTSAISKGDTKRSSRKVNANTTDTVSECSSPSQLQSLTGEALVSAVKSGNLSSCLYGLFDKSLVGTSVFSDESIITISHAISAHLTDYDGTESSDAAELEKLVIYLRAMHWAEFGNNRAFPEAYSNSLIQAFGQYFSGQHFATFNGEASRNFMVRYEMLVLLRSSGTNSIPYIERFTDALIGYANTVSRTDDWGVYYEENGMTQILTHLFNASDDQGEALEEAVQSSPQIINNLQQFVNSQGTWLIGHTREYQWADTVNELARFLRFGGEIAEQVRPSIQAILENFSHEGAGSSGWLKAQSSVSFYDAENCSLYGDACSFDLEATVLSGNHTCSSSLKIRYQEPIINENLTAICQSLAQQEQAFHTLFNTSSDTPVADDQNTDLEVVIFSSYSDYDNYAGNFFGISTNNGGMYLEGDPWTTGNQARFIAHQATWLPDFAVWNLNHEYVHYLDGRFNKWGNFNEQPANSVWWGEGIAEYLSQPNDNPNALAVAPQNTYSLSELFQTTYENSNTERTYYWGYLATRFMIEEQASEVENTLLPHFRAPKRIIPTGECQFDWGWKTKTEATANNWYWAYDDSEWASGSWVWTCGQEQPEITEVPSFTPYQDIINGWNTSFDESFSSWLTCLVAGDGICQTTIINPADMDGNNTVDKRDVTLFRQMLRTNDVLSLDYDFNKDNRVDRRDIRPMMALCDLARCAIAS